MNRPNEENAISCIISEIQRYKKCVHIKGIINHGEYVAGMIDLAARLKLITNSDAILFRDKSLETKKKLLKEFEHIENPRDEG